ncbi:putative RecB family exonuclease [Rudaeicoccus suwonensis]|uniref:Putative RecB family exonuclease n=2 Tax=Rudaeicoccus suwonensis TaxID=657409 RepID=A0A561EAY4_9MICO|nr:putative RecB family exonuclease [Rudaeicoccus suwonensis]
MTTEREAATADDAVSTADPAADAPAPRRAALSPSRASDFMQCPLLYRFRVVDRLPQPPSAAAARGTLVHAVLERLFDVPAGQRTVEAAHELIDPQWRQMIERDPDVAVLAGETDTELAAWLADAAVLVDRWFALEDPTRLEPAERELYVEADVDGLTLRGYVDRLDVAPTGEMRVVDYKTGRSPSELFEAKALFQMKFYALVLWRTRGVIPRMLQLVYLGNSEIVRYEPEERDLLATERKVKALWSAIERAAQTGDWRANKTRLCDWCDHKALCPEWGGTPPPLPAHAVQLALDPVRAGEVAPTEE